MTAQASAKLQQWLRLPAVWAGGLVLLAVALLYLLTLDNGLRPDELTGGDLITHQYAQVEARPSNAPGYPLYTMGGWLWYHAGWPVLSLVLNPVQHVSAYSMVWGLASLLVLYLILLNITQQWWPVALLLTTFYATTYFFWYYNVTTEQYTSAVFQTLLIILLAFRWDEAPRNSILLWLALISGTMLANMVTTLFILPPLLWFIFFKRDQNGAWLVIGILKQPWLITKAVGLALLPLLSYGFIYIRGSQHPEWRGAGQWPSNWAWFVEFITIQQGRDELVPGLSLHNIFTTEFPALMGYELTWLVLLGGLLGLSFLGRRRAIFLYLTLVIYLIFSWGYRFGNWFQVIIPAYPIFIIGFAALLKKIQAWASSWQSKSSPRFKSLFIAHCSLLIVLLLLLFRVTTNFPRANQRNLPTDTGLNPGWAILADQPAPPAHIATDFEERVALQYLQRVWRLAPELTAMAAGDLGNTTTASVSLYISRRAAADAPDTILRERYYPQAAGEQLILLLPVPLVDLPATATPLALNFGDELHLVGWEQVNLGGGSVASGQAPGAANWQIALYWRAETELDTDYTVSVRPMVNGQLLQHDNAPLIQDHQPVWGLYPTGQWRPNSLVRDGYALQLPPGVTPDAVQVVVYHAVDGRFENLGEGVIVTD